MSIAKSHSAKDALLDFHADPHQQQCHAVLHGFTIVVENRQDILFLVQLGCFGKGSLSRSLPLQLDGGECVYLLHEEAMYLSSRYGLNCLLVSDAQTNQVLREGQLWRALNRLSPTFAVKYVAYYSLRKANWIPKSGLKFGADFAIYLNSPTRYHARYSVVVIDDRLDAKEQRARSWHDLHCMMRTSHQVVKKVMLLYVQSDMLDVDLVDEREWLQSASVVSRIVKRWIPETDRTLNQVNV